MSSISDELYSDSAALGNITSLIYLIIAIVIGVILIISAIINFTSPKYLSINAIITNVNCKVSQENKTSSNCNLIVTYSVQNKNYTESLTITGTGYSVGQNINIEYLPSDPTQIRSASTSTTTMGIISSVLALIIVGGSYFNYYMTTHYKLFASAQGVNTLIKVF